MAFCYEGCQERFWRQIFVAMWVSEVVADSTELKKKKAALGKLKWETEVSGTRESRPGGTTEQTEEIGRD